MSTTGNSKALDKKPAIIMDEEQKHDKRYRHCNHRNNDGEVNNQQKKAKFTRAYANLQGCVFKVGTSRVKQTASYTKAK